MSIKISWVFHPTSLIARRTEHTNQHRAFCSKVYCALVASTALEVAQESTEQKMYFVLTSISATAPSDYIFRKIEASGEQVSRDELEQFKQEVGKKLLSVAPAGTAAWPETVELALDVI